MTMSMRDLIAGLLAPTLIFFTLPTSSAGEYPPRTGSPLTVRQIHSGHSLSDAYGSNPWPGRLILATALETGNLAYQTIHRSIIPGSPLGWRWTNASNYPDARQEIDGFELLVTTEAVPLTSNETWFKEDTLDALDRWVEHAWNYGNRGNGSEVLLYSTWTHWRYSATPPEDDGEAHLPFRERLEIQGALWEQMQDSANANRPEGMPRIYMIPGHRLMLRLHDDIATGRAPGLTSIGEIFADDIHLNALGQYAISCLVYAVIYQRDPSELPDRLAPQQDTFSPELARYLKAVVWEVATDYDRSGVPRQ